ncbi:MAG TPA: response regulator [Candidatus Limnocylindria bacterium]|nr:response regulator [Candidatus Limnocylindria bacterium]
MGLADVLPRINGRGPGLVPEAPDVAVLEDDEELATLAVEMCAKAGLSAARYSRAGEFLGAVSTRPPKLVVLDWRLERELGAAAFMAVRHRLGGLPIVCWTSTPAHELPAMLAGDALVRIVSKSAGVDAFEAAVRWAAARSAAAQPHIGHAIGQPYGGHDQ